MQDFFNEIVNQNTAKNILQSIYNSGRVPHAFLFFGPEGVGKFNTAIQFAKILNSNTNTKNADAVISKINSFFEPYVKLVMPLPRGKNETGDDSPTEKLSDDVLETINLELQKKRDNLYHKITIENANSIKINSIRDIKRFIAFNYADVNKRIIIILEAHLMNEEAQNALLKSLEEPPEGIVFILLTSDKNKLLPTILSRCWQVDFEPLQPNDIEIILQKFFKIDRQISTHVSKFADGSVYKALQLIENDFEKLLETTIQILRYSLGKRYFTAYNALKEITNDFSNALLKMIIDLIIKWFDDTYKNKSSYDNYYFKDFLDTIEKFNNKFNSVDIPNVITNLERLKELIDKNVSLNIISLCLIFEIAAITIGK
ncbi:ATP-binding protein [Melioribacteraceae bacterium 4301-Me]|uniref:DNA polymerase III subunit n=1 Tax=Pyranulibacter aquaticus TaxID=3163344 RepID=UPI0035992325